MLTLNEFGAEYQRIGNTRTFQRQDEIDGAKIIMDSIFTELQGAKAMVIDLRFNPGGKDEVSLEILGHLVKNRTKVATKKARSGNTFANHQDIFLESRLPSFDKKVYLLTGPLTASASDLASMSTLAMANVIRIGSATEGIFSDGLDKKLPNGWEYVLSNELYFDLAGTNYENVGIPPTIELNYPRDRKAFLNYIYKSLQDSGDAAIEQVYLLEKN